MVDSSDFDAFYADARERLLHQTYALTGDLPAAQAAVRDSFVASWSHWRRVSRLEDPERWARPLAWTHALRRSGARLWHRDKSQEAEVAATLDALGTLPLSQRRMLVLSALTRGSMEDLAREAGLSLASAERELQAATAAFSASRDVEPGLVRLTLEALRAPCADVSWPRASILRRAGTTRRRTHSLVGIGAAVALVVGSGVAAGYDGRARPTLARESPSATPSQSVQTPPPEPPARLNRQTMLAAGQLDRIAPKLRWRVTDTTENLEGDGLLLPCQQARFADPRATGALVRTFAADPRRTSGTGAPAKTTRTRAPQVAAAGYQLSELSRSPRAAQRAFDATLGWYAGCAEERVQLLSTRLVERVGDRAALLVLRSWAEPESTLTVGVARTGRVVVTTMSRTGVEPDPAKAASLLAAAVNGLCGSPGSGTCAGPPLLVPAPPFPVGSVPGMIGTIDLPPVPAIEAAWVGTEPRQALVNAAATQCDLTEFNRKPMSNAWTRTFLFPQADLPETFGLTETVATAPAAKAQALVAEVRRRMSVCEEKNLGTTVSRVAQVSTAGTDLSVWNLSIEISDQQTIGYQMGLVRRGTAVAQIGFTPTATVKMAPGEFVSLVERAQERLAEMPPPRGPAKG